MDDLEQLPSGKCHISFSEMTAWNSCSWRYNLAYVEGLSVFRDSHYADFGTAIHAAIEHYLMTRSAVSVVFAIELIKFSWDINDYEDKVPLKEAIEQAQILMSQFPTWLEENFPGWKIVEAEELLYEKTGFDRHPHAFKGFIDIVIETPVTKRNRKRYWILDAKTSFYGWHKDKRRDENVHRQVMLYKHYWCKKHSIDLDTVGTAFVILKRAGKKDACRIDLFKVSAGLVTLKKHLDVLDNVYAGIKRGIKWKNRYSCEWCEWANTPDCEGYVFVK